MAWVDGYDPSSFWDPSRASRGAACTSQISNQLRVVQKFRFKELEVSGGEKIMGSSEKKGSDMF
jgi:hypothetical protein